MVGDGVATIDREVPVTILLSGGLDSAACVSFYLTSGSPVDAIFVDYGQPAARFEFSAASAIASQLAINLSTIECRGFHADPTTEVMGRNGFLYFAALVQGGRRRRLIASGLHDGTPFYDSSPRFLRAVDSLIAEQTNGMVRAVAPFLTWSKALVWKFCEEQSVPIQLTRSCDAGSAAACGECISCLDRKKLR